MTSRLKFFISRLAFKAIHSEFLTSRSTAHDQLFKIFNKASVKSRSDFPKLCCFSCYAMFRSLSALFLSDPARAGGVGSFVLGR